MNLKAFIKLLEDIAREHGDSLKVIMADAIPVVEPVFSDKYKVPSVVITDQN